MKFRSSNLVGQDNQKVILGTGNDVEILFDGSDYRVQRIGGNPMLKITPGGDSVFYQDGAAVLSLVDITGSNIYGLQFNGQSGAQSTQFFISGNLAITNEELGKRFQLNATQAGGTAVNLFSGEPDGGVSLFYNDFKTIETISTGIVLGDGTIDGTNPITNGDTAQLKVTGNNLDIQVDQASGAINLLSSGGETMIKATSDGSVEIYHDNLKKIETSATGVSVTGNIVVTGTVDGIDIGVDVAANNSHRTSTLNPHSVTPSQIGAADSNKISQLDSDVTVTDAGTGDVKVNVDSGEIADFNASGMQLGATGARITSISTDGTLSADLDTLGVTMKAVKTYVDNVLAANDAMVYKGSIDASTNPNYPAADAGHAYKISAAGKIGGASGEVVEIGDMAICLVDSSPSGTQAAVGANWNIIQVNIDGAVTGPASATDNAVARFDLTTGKLIKSSLVTIDNNGSVNIPSGQEFQINSVKLAHSDLGGIGVNDHHNRLHSLTDVLDHSGGNWKVVHTNGSGQVVELALGTLNNVLKSGGPSAAPTFGQVAHSELSGVSADQHHARSHAVTGASDHTAGNWKVLHSNGSGNIVELALGADNTFLKSNGPSAAPSFATPTAIFGSEFQQTSSDGVSTTTSDAYQQKVRLTTTSLPSGTYLINYQYERWLDGQAGWTKVELDDTTVLSENVHDSSLGDLTNGYTLSGGFYIAALSGVKTIDIDYRSQNSGQTSYIRRARISLWRVA